MKKTANFIIFFLFLAGLLLRFYKINEPLADWHSWRQADTASVSRRFLTEGIDLLHPKYHDLSNIPNGLDNPEGYRMVEFPLYNAVHVVFFRLQPDFLNFEGAGRFVSIVFGLMGVLFLYLLVKKEWGSMIAMAVLAFYLFLPFNIFYQRTILPENLMIAASLAFLYFFSNYSDLSLSQSSGFRTSRNDAKLPVYYIFKYEASARCLNLFIAILSLSVALLIKPTAVFLVLPAVYLAFKPKNTFSRLLHRVGEKNNTYPALPAVLKNPGNWLVAGIPLLFFLLWRWWIAHFPEGIPAFSWLLNGNHIRFKPSFFRWIFGDRIGRLIFGYWGLSFVAFFFLGKKKAFGLAWYFLFGALAYLFVVATGNVQHDYYQTLIMPALSILAGIGLLNFWNYSSQVKAVKFGFIVVLLLFTFSFSWFFVRDYYNINHPEIVEAGLEADRILPPEAKIIAPYMGDTAFLYQTHRNGWPIGGGIEDKIKMGAEYYISVNRGEETVGLMEKCKTIEDNSSYVIVNLKECKL